MILLGFTVFSPILSKIAISPIDNEMETASSPMRRELQTSSSAIHNESRNVCLRNEFSNVVLVIVFNFPHYSNIPDLTALYKNAFPTIMFCGPENATGRHTVEALDIHKGYFGYMCMSRAMQKHPGYSGYLLIADDLMLKYWNLVGLNRDQIWEGPKVPKGINIQNQTWNWWNTEWGREACQKALNGTKTSNESNPDVRLSEKINNHTNEHTYQSTMVWNMTKAIDVLKKNGNGRVYCHRGRSDVFYSPRRFSDAFTKLSDIFYKHRTFLEITVPTIFRLIDFQENFEYIPGIYIQGSLVETAEGKTKHFWEEYKKLAFVHPFKLHGKTLHSILLRSWIIEYSDILSNCENTGHVNRHVAGT